ncbi:MAG: SufE family protein [Myxococcota bacterium]
MTASIADKQAALIARFNAIPSWEDRYREIIRMGRDLPAFPEEHRLDKNKVKGCQSQVWMHARPESGRVHYEADSDAAIVKGLISLVLEVYSGHTFDEIIATPATFVDGLGLGQHLSQSRANGLSAMLKQVKLYALAFKAMANKQPL